MLLLKQVCAFGVVALDGANSSSSECDRLPIKVKVMTDQRPYCFSLFLALSPSLPLPQLPTCLACLPYHRMVPLLILGNTPRNAQNYHRQVALCSSITNLSWHDFVVLIGSHHTTVFCVWNSINKSPLVTWSNGHSFEFKSSNHEVCLFIAHLFPEAIQHTSTQSATPIQPMQALHITPVSPLSPQLVC